MLQEVREDAGLGCPPDSITTNASETANFIVKNKVDYKRNQLVEYVQESTSSSQNTNTWNFQKASGTRCPPLKKSFL